MGSICKWGFNAPAKTICMLVLLFSAVMIGAAFFIEHVLEVAPCKMCWWQRYGHWGIAGLAFLGAIAPCVRLKKVLIVIMVPVAMVSGGIGAYQGLGQLGFVELPFSCEGGAEGGSITAPANLLAALEFVKLAPSCSDASYTVLGITLAGWNVFIMLIFIVCLTIWLFKNFKSNSKCALGKK